MGNGEKQSEYIKMSLTINLVALNEGDGDVRGKVVRAGRRWCIQLLPAVTGFKTIP